LDRTPVLITAAVVAVASAPVAWWWKVGHQVSHEDPQPALSAQRAMVQHIVGLGGAVICLAALTVLVVATLRRSLEPVWWIPLVPLLIAGGLFGTVVRLLALPIGDGMVGVGILFDLIAALALAGWGVVVGAFLSRRGRPGHQQALEGW
jgi:hypothetical protein